MDVSRKGPYDGWLSTETGLGSGSNNLRSGSEAGSLGDCMDMDKALGLGSEQQRNEGWKDRSTEQLQL
jgi:hypothetical protein